MFKWLQNKLQNRKTRSSYAYGWRKLRNKHIEKNPLCAICGYKSSKNDVHHIIPRHVDESKVLDSDNLITLCRKYDCHLRFGHFGNYTKYWNPDIRSFSKIGEQMSKIEQKYKDELLG